MKVLLGENLAHALRGLLLGRDAYTVAYQVRLGGEGRVRDRRGGGALRILTIPPQRRSLTSPTMN